MMHRLSNTFSALSPSTLSSPRMLRRRKSKVEMERNGTQTCDIGTGGVEDIDDVDENDVTTLLREKQGTSSKINLLQDDQHYHSPNKQHQPKKPLSRKFPRRAVSLVVASTPISSPKQPSVVTSTSPPRRSHSLTMSTRRGRRSYRHDEQQKQHRHHYCDRDRDQSSQCANSVVSSLTTPSTPSRLPSSPRLPPPPKSPLLSLSVRRKASKSPGLHKTKVTKHSSWEQNEEGHDVYTTTTRTIRSDGHTRTERRKKIIQPPTNILVDLYQEEDDDDDNVDAETKDCNERQNKKHSNDEDDGDNEEDESRVVNTNTHSNGPSAELSTKKDEKSSYSRTSSTTMVRNTKKKTSTITTKTKKKSTTEKKKKKKTSSSLSTNPSKKKMGTTETHD